MKVGDKVVRRRMFGKKSDKKIGKVKEINHKWMTVLVVWDADTRGYWHSMDDVEIFRKGVFDES